MNLRTVDILYVKLSNRKRHFPGSDIIVQTRQNNLSGPYIDIVGIAYGIVCILHHPARRRVSLVHNNRRLQRHTRITQGVGRIQFHNNFILRRISSVVKAGAFHLVIRFKTAFTIPGSPYCQYSGAR